MCFFFCLISAVPYFVLALEDQFADSGAELHWRCEAGGQPEPTYYWLKNGVVRLFSLNAATLAVLVPTSSYMYIYS